jgi:hypothetical protein
MTGLELTLVPTEPQNVEQGMSNEEVVFTSFLRRSKFLVRHSTFFQRRLMSGVLINTD